MSPTRFAEDAAVQEAAERFRRAGFRVTQDEQLDLCGGFKPDLIARNGTETTVVAVRPRSALAADANIAHVVREIESIPDWSFELVIVPEPELLDAPGAVQSLDDSDIAQRLKDAEDLLESARIELAFLWAWSALEAKLRRSMAASEDSGERVTSTRFLINHVSFLGIVDDNDIALLRSLSATRNAIVHGFALDGIDTTDVRRLITLVRHLPTSVALEE